MFGLKRKWWLCIISASVFLLFVRCINASKIDNDVSTNTTSESTDVEDKNNFETIDVAQQQQNEGNNNLQVQTGQTTRIVTSGEVDDNFWLKHLGEDFKYAIHLQVGDSSYNGIYNMSQDGSNYDINHDNHINEVPVDVNRNELQNNQNNRNDNYENPTNTKESCSDYNQNSNHTTEQTIEEVKNYEDFYVNAERNQPLVKKESAFKKHQITKYTKHTKPTETQNINTRYVNKEHKYEKTTSQQHYKHDSNTTPEQEENKNISSDSWKSQDSPIVVNLSNIDKSVYHTEYDEEPVVVKMPPVIYHQDPTYSEYTSEESSTNETTSLQHSESKIPTHNQYTTSHQTQQSLQYENTDFTQYNSMSQHSVGNSPHSIHSPYLSSMMPQFTSQYYHNQPMLINPSVYHSESVYTSSPALKANFNPIQSPKEDVQKSTDSVHFILRKPSISYNGHESHNEIAMDNTF